MISLQLVIVLCIVAFAAIQLALKVRSQWRNAMAKQKSSCGGCTACPVARKAPCSSNFRSAPAA
jgi:hypothetical protein